MGPVRQSAQAFGPVLGGLLTQGFGFRSIFALLLALTATALLGVVFFLPETHRDIAGNGTIRLFGINKPLIYYLKKQREAYYAPEGDTKAQKKLTRAVFLSPLRWLLEKDIICLLGLGAIVYTVQSMMTASTTMLFKSRYRLNDLQLGFVFIPNGIGNVIGSIVNGRLLDRDMRRVEADYRREKKIPDKQQLKPKQYADFPLERARLAKMPILVGSFATFTAGYGVSFLSEPADTDDLVTQLVMQFFMAATSAAVLNTNQTSMTDLFPGNSASAVALNNLVRCSLGAVGVGVVDRLIAAVGPMFVR
jgi:MFS family permease